MNSVKLNKKHLFSFFITLVLLFSLNLNAFAVNSNVVHFGDYSFTAYYFPNDTMTDCTSKVTRGNSNQSINGVSIVCTSYLFSGTSSYDKLLNTGADLGLYTDTQYNFNFYTKVGLRSGYKYNFLIQLIVMNENEEGIYVTLYDGKDLDTNTWNKVEGSFKTPDISGNVTASLIIMLRTTETDSTSNMMYLSDMTLTLDDPLINGKPITTPDTDDLNGTLSEYDNVVGSLPSIDKNETDKLFDFNVDSYTASLNFIKDMFDNILEVFGFASIVTFALCIGLATYIIGRKVG